MTIPALLFVIAGLVSLTVLVRCCTAAFAAFGELRRALAHCDDVVIARVTIVEQRTASLRLVSSNELTPRAPQPDVLRAAA